MNKTKVVMSCATALAFVALLAGCGASNKSAGTSKSNVKVEKTGFPIVKDKLTLTMFAPANGKGSYDTMAVLTDYAKKTNVNFKYTTPPASDASTKLNLALASGDLSDILYASQISKQTEIEYGGSSLLALEKYIDEGYAPNLKKILDANPNVKKSITTPDGHIYSLPYLNAKYNVDTPKDKMIAMISKGSLWYNGKWMKKLGIEQPKTTDDLYNMLVKFRDEDPNGNGQKDEIPLSTSAADGDKLASLRPWIMNAFGVHLQEQQVDDKGKVTYGAATKEYRDYLAYMHKLYSEKLLDQETFSQSDDQKKAKGAKDQLGSYMDWYSYFTSGKAPEVAIEDPMATPLSSPDNSKAFMDVSDGISTGAFAVSSKCPSPEAAVRWIDYFYSKEGSDFLNIGPDKAAGGMWHWETNKEGQKVHVLNDDVPKDKAEDFRESITPDFGHVVPKVGSMETPILLPSKDAPVEKDTFAKWIDKEAAEKVGPYESVGWPTLYLSKDEQAKLGSTTQTDLLSYVQQQEAKFITGKEELNDDTWQKYQDTLKKIGVDKLVKVMQEAYDTWNKA